MPVCFLDTSALLKLYFDEVGSGGLERLATAPATKLAFSSLGLLEFRAVVRARVRDGSIDAAEGEAMLADLSGVLSRRSVRQGLSDAVVQQAGSLLDRHGLRAPDALQLASCAAVGRNQPGVIFVCSDRRLLAAARIEGIPCWDPAEPEAAPA